MEETKFLSDVEVSSLCRIGLSTLRNWRSQGCGPAYSKCGSRAVRYELKDVLAFMRENKIIPTN